MRGLERWQDNKWPILLLAAVNERRCWCPLAPATGCAGQHIQLEAEINPKISNNNIIEMIAAQKGMESPSSLYKESSMLLKKSSVVVEYTVNLTSIVQLLGNQCSKKFAAFSKL